MDCIFIVLEELTDIKESLGQVMAVTPNSKIPLGLKQNIRETFKCQICQDSPLKPPVIITKCCKTILGCEECVNQLYSGTEALSKTCPLCRAERGCNETMLLRGLSDFLRLIKECTTTEDEQ